MINPSQDGRHVFVTIGPLSSPARTSYETDNTRTLSDPYRRLATPLEATAFKPAWSGMLYDPMLTGIPSDYSNQQDRLEGLRAAYVRPEHMPRNANPFWQVLARENPSWGLGTAQASRQQQPIGSIPVVLHQLLESNPRLTKSSLANTRTTSSSGQESKHKGNGSGHSQIGTAPAGFVATDSATATMTMASSPPVLVPFTSLSQDEYAVLAAVRASFLKEPYISPLLDTTQYFISLPTSSREGLLVRPIGQAIKRRFSGGPEQDYDTDQEDEEDENEDVEEEEAEEDDPHSLADPACTPLIQERRKRTRISGQGLRTAERRGDLDYQSMMYNLATMSMVDLHRESTSMSPSLTSSSGSDVSTDADPSSLINMPLRTQLGSLPFKSRYTRSPAPSPSSRSGSSPSSDQAPAEPPHCSLKGSIHRPRSTRDPSSPPGIKKRRSRDTRYLQFKRVVAVKGGHFIFECNACPRGHFQFQDDRQLKRHAVCHLFSKSRNKFRCLDCPDGQNFARRDAVRRHFESVTYKCCFDRGFYEELDSDRDEYIRRRIEPHWTKSSR